MFDFVGFFSLFTTADSFSAKAISSLVSGTLIRRLRRVLRSVLGTSGISFLSAVKLTSHLVRAKITA